MGAIQALQRAGQTPEQPLARHTFVDGGKVDPEDGESNDATLLYGGRLSRYRLRDGTVVWVITEGNRSRTTLILPGAY